MTDATDWKAEADTLRRERDELAARLAEIAAQPPVAWIEHELQGTGLRHLHFERRPNTLRDEVVDPVWTELIARPAPAAAPELAEPIGCQAEPELCRCIETCGEEWAFSVVTCRKLQRDAACR